MSVGVEANGVTDGGTPTTDAARDAGTGAARVVSLGSVNVDRTHEVSADEIARLRGQYHWFPAGDETVTVESVPAAVAADPDAVGHGGKGANQAVAAAAAGADTAILGCVGPDAAEVGVYGALESAGVETDHLAETAAQTGTAHVFREPSGENRIAVVPGANARLDDDYVRNVESVVRGADCLLVQNEVSPGPVAALLDRLAGDPDRPSVVYDPAPPAGAKRLLGCAAVDCCTPNRQEAETLADALAEFDGVVVRKRGPDPVVVSDEGGGSFEVSPPAVDVVDTTGAGDVFAGYLGAGLAAGRPLRSAVERAVVAASLSTRAAGARGGVPSVETVREFERTGEQ